MIIMGERITKFRIFFTCLGKKVRVHNAKLALKKQHFLSHAGRIAADNNKNGIVISSMVVVYFIMQRQAQLRQEERTIQAKQTHYTNKRSRLF